ncbi:MAG: AtpZ/AtpI family protein [Candidatus Sumerlaeia bacterium]|nr:AtpZ/AtpI family protein [Candidatus Sumerlaeia bacterium]
MDKDNKWRKRGEAFRMEGIAFAIPMVLVVFPVVGVLLGRFLGRLWDLPWLMFVGLVLGLVAGVRECIRLVRVMNRSQRK